MYKCIAAILPRVMKPQLDNHYTIAFFQGNVRMDVKSCIANCSVERGSKSFSYCTTDVVGL